jgi:hypothetical protein
MKRIPLLLVLACLLLAAKAQKPAQGRQFLIDKCQPFYIGSLKMDKGKRANSAIRQVEVVDFRPDTSRIGFLTQNRRWKDARFRAGLRQELDGYLNQVYAHPAGTQSLLIIIKKCWLFDTVMARPDLAMIKKAGKGKIVFRAEAFLKTGAGYAPYAYHDTVITSTASAFDIIYWRLPALLDVLMNKVSEVEEAAVLRRSRYLSFRTLDSLNKRRFAFPMDTATVLRKGVYASLEEFRNNQPSILQYAVERNAEGHMDLFLKDEEGKPYFSRKMWGYCDGEHCYVMMDGSLFPILPVDHAWYVLGSREYKRVQTSVPILLLVPGAWLFSMEPVAETAVRKLSVFQLDAHTGQID